MKKTVSFVLLTTAAFILISTSLLQAQAVSTTGKDKIVKGNNAFAVDLYKNLKEKEGNLFFSPYSISTALAMTYAGARENTERQMADVLHFGLSQDQLHPAFASLEGQMNAVQSKGDIQLNIANALWGQDGHVFLEEFLDITDAHYQAALSLVDFKRDTEGARLTINGWVEDKTKNKIRNLIKPGMLNPLTRLILTNAIYFKGAWLNEFDEDATRGKKFWMNNDILTDVQTMANTKIYGYYENNNLQILEMPYKGRDLSMIILLPKRRDDLSSLEENLQVDTLAIWLRRIRRQKVEVYFPKFRMNPSFALAGTLAKMGMSDAFSPENADFSGMDGVTDPERKLYISQVIHQAFVDVDEKGTEAAAATAVVMWAGSAMPSPNPPPIPVFRADHPFMFMIRENATGSILFLGRVVDPTEN